MALSLGILKLIEQQIGLAWFFGARFDLAFKSIKEGNFKSPQNTPVEQIVSKYEGRDEL